MACRYCRLLVYLSLGYLGVLGASNVLGLWKVVLNLGLRFCFHVLFLTAFKAFWAFCDFLSAGLAAATDNGQGYCSTWSYP